MPNIAPRLLFMLMYTGCKQLIENRDKSAHSNEQKKSIAAAGQMASQWLAAWAMNLTVIRSPSISFGFLIQRRSLVHTLKPTFLMLTIKLRVLEMRNEPVTDQSFLLSVSNV